MEKKHPMLKKLSHAWILPKPETIIAVLALLLAVFSAAATHKQNRPGVIPKLSFIWIFDSNGAKERVGLFVEKSGAGPAVIKNFRKTNFDRFTDEVTSEEPSGFEFSPTYFFQNGMTKPLMTVESANVKDKAAFNQLISGEVLITIEYCSIYGDCWKECSNFKNPTCDFKKSPAEDIFNAGFWSKIL